MKRGLDYFPFVLIAFLILMLGLTNQAVGADVRAMATLLAPMLWIGLGLLASIPSKG